MAKRLVITGLPCPAEAWSRFLGPDSDQRIIPIREVFENTTTSDPREMSRYVTEQILREKPSSILCHDMGVPLTLMSLLRLKRRGKLHPMRLTIFNGAFRKVPLSRARQPLRIQFIPLHRVIRDVENQGGQVDWDLKPYMPRIRAMYRSAIRYRMIEKLTSALGLEDIAGFSPKNRLGIPIQIIASPNDPYLPFDSIDQLRRDISSERFIEVEYGHFPYSIDPKRILQHLTDFGA